MAKRTDSERVNWLEKNFGVALLDDDNGHWAISVSSTSPGVDLSLSTVEDLELVALAEEWRRTRQKASSSIVKLAMHPAYQRIIGKGRAAIPFLLRELQKEPDHWFWALTAITGKDPVREEDRGDFVAMTRAWIEWGKQSDYL